MRFGDRWWHVARHRVVLPMATVVVANHVLEHALHQLMLPGIVPEVLTTPVVEFVL